MPRKPREIGDVHVASWSLWAKPDSSTVPLPLQERYDWGHGLSQQLALYRECGIALDTQVYQLGWSMLMAGQRYTYQVVGTLLEPTTPPDAPRVNMDRVPELPQPGLVAWRRRVWCEDNPLSLEASWHPTAGAAIALRGLERDPRRASVLQAYNGIALFNLLESAGGRPRPREIEDKARFWQLYWDAYQKVLADKRRTGSTRPTKVEVAAELLMSVRTLLRHRERWSLPWPPRAPP